MLDSDIVQSLIDLNDTAVDFKSAEGTILAWGKGAQQLYGYQTEEVVGLSAASLQTVAFREKYSKLIFQVVTSKTQQSTDLLRQKKDGSVIPILLTVKPILNPEGQLLGLAGISKSPVQQRSSMNQTLLAVLEHDLLSYFHDVERIIDLTLKSSDGLNRVEEDLLKRLLSENMKTKEYVADLIQYGKLRNQTKNILSIQPIEQLLRQLEQSNRNYNIRILNCPKLTKLQISPSSFKRMLEILVERLQTISSSAKPVFIDCDNSETFKMNIFCQGMPLFDFSNDSFNEDYDDGAAAAQSGLGRKGLALAEIIARLHNLRLEYFKDGELYGFRLANDCSQPVVEGKVLNG